MQSTTTGRSGQGILLYLAGVFFFAANDALGKWLVADYSVGELMLFRSLGAALVLLAAAKATGSRLQIKDQWALHILRIFCLTADAFSFYFATKALPLADVMTFYMAGPLIVTALSRFLLGERVGVYRWGAVSVGFAGVIIALQPTSAAVSPAAFVALFGAFMFGLAMVITRKLRDAHWLPLVTWQFVGAGFVGAIVAPFAWTTPSVIDVSLMALVGVFASGCFILVTKALALAPASLIAPFQYSAILWGVLLGWLVWHNVPTLPIVIGNCIIIGSGLFVFYRERRLQVSVNDVVQQIP